MSERLEEENKRLKEKLRQSLVIVDAAYWDHYGAGTIPGSGYDNSAQNEAGKLWSWRHPDEYKKWKTEADQLTKRLPCPLCKDEGSV